MTDKSKKEIEIESLAKIVANMQKSIDRVVAQLPDLASSDTVSNTVSKPRTFTELRSLQYSVSNLYAGRLQSRLNELDVLRPVNEWYEKTGVLELPEDNDALQLWSDYLQLLSQYCNDVEDLLCIATDNIVK
jgi:hypothetical protein